MMVPRKPLIAVCSIFPPLSSIDDDVKTCAFFGFGDRSVIQN